MNILQPKILKQRAASLLSENNCGKIILLYGAILYGASMLLSVLDLLFIAAIDTAGGLAGMDIRAFWSTVQSLLSMAVSLALPYWQIAIVYICIRLTRQQEVELHVLKRGFDRFGPVLRYNILLAAIMFGVSMAASYLTVPFLINIPIPDSLQEFLVALGQTEEPQALLESTELVTYFISLLLPMLLISGGAMLYISYRLRLCHYLLLDDPKSGAIQAMSLSGQMTKGYKWQLFKLDLSFWWYYLLQGVLASLPMVPAVLIAAGAAVPSLELLYLLAQLVSFVGSMALLRWKGLYVELTYACAYDRLRTPPQQITVI